MIFIITLLDSFHYYESAAVELESASIDTYQARSKQYFWLGRIVKYARVKRQPDARANAWGYSQ